jgi:NADPH-dependent 2,4-dienoyl-CoA reductase/sulfur reductase-like enzyme
MSKIKTEIVVVGGGSGAGMIHNLLPNIDLTKHNVTLINTHPYCIWWIATARMAVTSEGSLENSGLIPFNALINQGVKFIEGRVSRIVDGVVELDSGKAVNYDYLVVATGSTWSGPINFPDGDAPLKEHLKRWRDKFSGASGVVIVGGGAVGIGASNFTSSSQKYYDGSIIIRACK